MQEHKLLNKELKFINGTHELIYGVDIETHRIIYANKALKEQFGDVEGKLCYETFQGLDKPCPFCSIPITTKQIGEPYFWKFRNKINNQWYFIVDVCKKIDGRLIQIEKAYPIPEKLANTL
jgi:hypothetical protein